MFLPSRRKILMGIIKPYSDCREKCIFLFLRFKTENKATYQVVVVTMITSPQSAEFILIFFMYRRRLGLYSYLERELSSLHFKHNEFVFTTRKVIIWCVCLKVRELHVDTMCTISLECVV